MRSLTVIALVGALVCAPSALSAQPSMRLTPPAEAFRRPPVQLERDAQLSLPPWVTWIGLAATAALGTSFVWSAATLRDARIARDTGQDGGDAWFVRRRRQAIALGVATGAAGLATALVALFATRWDPPSAEIWVTHEGGGVSYSRTF